MACRYPGARTPAELWENVLAPAARRSAACRPQRLRLEDYLSADPADPRSAIYATEAAVIEDWEFDRVRFRVAGSTFRDADLAHWLALDVAVAGPGRRRLPRRRQGLPRDTTGVLVGNSLTGEFSRANLLRQRWPYVRRVLGRLPRVRRAGTTAELAAFLAPDWRTTYKAPFPAPSEESLAGGLSNTIAGRICNHFDLHGGGYTVDGACASSLLAVAQACSAAGRRRPRRGPGRRRRPVASIPSSWSASPAPAPCAGGEMRVFDARSAGLHPRRGLRLRGPDAGSGRPAACGCRIHAVIRGWGISSDGSGGISRPEADGPDAGAAPAPTAAPASASARWATSRATAPARRSAMPPSCRPSRWALREARSRKEGPPGRARSRPSRPHQGRRGRGRPDQGHAGPRAPRSCRRTPVATSRTAS